MSNRQSLSSTSVSRRQILQVAAGAVGTMALPGTVRAVEAGEEKAATKGNIRHSLVTWCFEPHWQFRRALQDRQPVGLQERRIVPAGKLAHGQEVWNDVRDRAQPPVRARNEQPEVSAGLPGDAEDENRPVRGRGSQDGHHLHGLRRGERRVGRRRESGPDQTAAEPCQDRPGHRRPGIAWRDSRRSWATRKRRRSTWPWRCSTRGPSIIP